MRTRNSWIIAMVTAATAGACVQSADGSGAPADADIAIVGVAVIPMSSPGVDEDQTVLVAGDRIVAVGPAAETAIPDGAQVIDGTGKYLMPGLAEMHAHVPPQANPSREVLADIMFLYVANGVTTIRGMLGAEYQLGLAQELSDGGMLGPTFYVAAPSLNGNSAPDPTTAERLVRQYKEAGYHLLKIHPGITRPTWDILAATAMEVGIPMAGHIPSDVGLSHALETGHTGVDHLDGYLEAMVGYDIMPSSLSPLNAPVERARSLATPEAMENLAQESLRRNAHVVPTMYLWDNFFLQPDPDSMTALPEMRYVSRLQREGWASQSRSGARVDQEIAEWVTTTRRQMLGALHEAGVNILMGTDSPQMFNVPGFALHRELRTYEEAGMSPWEILRTGTTSVSRYVDEVLGLDGSFGTVEPGSRADLVLLSANPLEDLTNLEARAGVMVRGRWISVEEIEAGLEALAAKHER